MPLRVPCTMDSSINPRLCHACDPTTTTCLTGVASLTVLMPPHLCRNIEGCFVWENAVNTVVCPRLADKSQFKCNGKVFAEMVWEDVRCALLDIILHSRMPLDHTHGRFKHVPWVYTFLLVDSCELLTNTEGGGSNSNRLCCIENRFI
jgi:hypothetical protein